MADHYRSVYSKSVIIKEFTSQICEEKSNLELKLKNYTFYAKNLRTFNTKSQRNVNKGGARQKMPLFDFYSILE